MGKKLSEMQERFIDYFIETGNKTDAARRAGYKRPEVQGSQNYEKLRVCIDERLAEKVSKRIADQDEVLRTITDILRNQEASDKDRLKAAELMGKRHGLFSEKIKLDISPVVIGGADELK